MRLGTLVEDLKTFKRTLAFSSFPFASLELELLIRATLSGP